MTRFLKVSAIGLMLLAASGVPALGATRARPWPDTASGIHVFNDQLPSGMSDAQVRFAARHYDGTQKMLRSEADRLRAIDPGFLILHYRLGEGLGYRSTTGNCRPNGDYLRIIQGNRWIREWPSSTSPRWFYKYGGSNRVLMCAYGWYLMNLDNSSWRGWWQDRVLRQVKANGDDGVFMDSLSVPNYFGGSVWRPRLPDVSPAFEEAWSSKIHRWLQWLQDQPLGRRYYLVPNVGSWITSRDATNYSPADGVMVEGFALNGNGDPYALSDWKLQADRILSLATKGRAVIGQTYVTRRRERGFALGTYLLLKHDRSYINIDTGLAPEWWPEYGIPIGKPQRGTGTAVAGLYDAQAGVYRRRFTRGLVLVNPTSTADGTAAARTVRLGRTMYLAVAHGGGDVPSSGRAPGNVTYEAVRSVRLAPYSAAVLLNTRP
jgi:hypothetical protein